MQDRARLIPALIELAQDAGARIMAIYQAGFEVTHKSDQTPVTEADLAAHHAILAGLDILTPGLPVLSEESEEVPFSERSRWRTYWLIDPLDGTREFIKRNGEFTINIALIEEHQPTLGLVYAPVSGACYYAARGHGAFKRGKDGTTAPIQVKSRCDARLIVAGSRSQPSTSFRAFLSKISDYEVITIGSSLKSCLVAEGKVDIYPRLGPTSEWDTAAAQCIVEEAGGLITDLSLQPLRYNTKDSLLNPHFVVFGDCSRNWQQYF